jgi:hypothetical protein
MDRRAALGYVIYLVARRVVRRKARAAAKGLDPRRAIGGRRSRALPIHPDMGALMLKNRSSSRATADRAGSVIESLRPVVTRALSDPELHLALRNALNTGRMLTDELGGTKPKKAAKKIADDKKLRRRVQSSALELRDAFGHVAEPPAKRRGRGLLKLILAAGAAAGAYYLAKKRGDDAGADDFS